MTITTDRLDQAPGGPNWREPALCRDPGRDVNLWFPVAEKPAFADQIAQARAVCDACPIERACLDHALASGAKFGIWGGLTAAERERVAR